MYHILILYIFKIKTLSLIDSVLFGVGKSVVFLVFALLICNSARSLASGLARGLALTAAAVLNGVSDILSFDCLDSAHCEALHRLKFLLSQYSISYIFCQ
jgi:uncharacterized membrane protein